MTNIIILDELTIASAEVRDAIAALTAAIVKEKNSEIHDIAFKAEAVMLTAASRSIPIQDFPLIAESFDITGIPVPHNWGEIQGYGHKQGAMTFIETLATDFQQDEEDDGNPHCYQDVLELEIQFLALKLELAKALKAKDIDQLVMCNIWENIEKCSSIQELKDIVF